MTIPLTTQALVDIPTDYRSGYEKAHALMPDIADKYVAHTLIGDPLADEMVVDLAELGEEKSNLII